MEPRTDWAESIAPGEEAELLALAEILRGLQRGHNAKGGPGRGLHRKPHAGVRAEVRTRDGLPAPYRVGIFAAAGTYPAYVRLSSGSGRRQTDAIGDVRGFALKIVGVPGKKLIPGMEDAPTQDFLLIDTPSTPFRDANEFVRLVQVVNNPLLLPTLLVRIGPGRTLAIARRLVASLKRPPASLASKRYWSAAATRYGAHAARWSLTPVDVGDAGVRGEGPDALRGDAAARLRAGPLAYTLSAQLYVDPRRTPIEDGSAEWLEEDSPPVAVADVVLPRQDLAGAAGRRIDELVERLAFDPWHAPVEFRPLGNLMRARNHAYRLSGIERGAAPEPERVDPGEPA